MAQQTLFLGTNPNDHTGESLRGGGAKINEMFTEVYALQSQTINAGAVEYNFTGATNEQRIQLAINAAVLGGFDRVYVPAFMLPYDASLVTFNTAIQMVREGGLVSVFDVQAYGAAVGNVINAMPAISAAAAGLVAASGGVLHFPPGIYLASTASANTYQVRVPVAGANFTPADQMFGYQLLFQNVTGIHISGAGATLNSTVNQANLPVGTASGAIILCDGVRHFTVDGLNFTSITQRDGAGTVTVAGLNGLAFTSQTRDSYSIAVRNSISTDVYTAFYAFGDAASTFRVRGIRLDALRHEGGVYTLACHNNGDNVQAHGVQSINTSREYFVFGVSGHYVSMYSETGTAGFGSVIKAYDRDVTDITYSLFTRKTISAPHVSIQSQHHVATQPTPARCLNISVEVNNQGVTNAVGVGFDYYQDTTLTGTSSNNLFDGITLSGIHEQAPVLTTSQNGTVAARGRLNTDRLILLNGALYNLYNRTGFYDNKQTLNTFVPNLRINGVTTGITYSGTTKGEFWRDGQWIEALVRIVLTNKGASVGSVTLDLPVVSGSYSSGNPVLRGMGFANMSGLTSPISGYVQNAGTLAVLQHQSATAMVDLANTNLTNTSDMLLHIRYTL